MLNNHASLIIDVIGDRVYGSPAAVIEIMSFEKRNRDKIPDRVATVDDTLVYTNRNLFVVIDRGDIANPSVCR